MAALSAKELAAKYDDPQRVTRLVAFCRTGAADFYGWDPQDVREKIGLVASARGSINRRCLEV
jgi:hypothetical protein